MTSDNNDTLLFFVFILFIFLYIQTVFTFWTTLVTNVTEDMCIIFSTFLTNNQSMDRLWANFVSPCVLYTFYRVRYLLLITLVDNEIFIEQLTLCALHYSNIK
jgi:hypothetical protein